MCSSYARLLRVAMRVTSKYREDFINGTMKLKNPHLQAPDSFFSATPPHVRYSQTLCLRNQPLENQCWNQPHFLARPWKMAGWAWVGLEKGCARGARAKKKIDRFGSHHKPPVNYFRTLRGLAIEIAIFEPASRFLSAAGKSRGQPANFCPIEIVIFSGKNRFAKRAQEANRHSGGVQKHRGRCSSKLAPVKHAQVDWVLLGAGRLLHKLLWRLIA